ncbi:hypothetical protein EIP91_002222 [Steccherinum ochraceum]|uniref:Uncharacterized protein n=1 Tax=Steccherinum ochraceum TaxID=92696 RepID=A0A4R0RGC0_9APHY|nr:hypothetical protein EIP91_002222 [Steccherinum ochraceum]
MLFSSSTMFTSATSQFLPPRDPVSKVNITMGSESETGIAPWLVALMVVGALLVLVTLSCVFLDGGRGVRRFMHSHKTSRLVLTGGRPTAPIPHPLPSVLPNLRVCRPPPPAYTAYSHADVGPLQVVVPVHATGMAECGAKGEGLGKVSV